MTIDEARAVAVAASINQIKAFVVWRMPLWPKEVYGVIEAERMPFQGVLIERVDVKAQGSLF